jgi:hypothetical protein
MHDQMHTFGSRDMDIRPWHIALAVVFVVVVAFAADIVTSYRKGRRGD